MNAMEQFIKAKLLQADLKEIDQQLSQGGFKNMGSMLLVKQSLLTISNLVDLELSVRVIYKQYPILSEIYRRHEAKYRFAKYLRNKFVGHVKQELILKAIEWRPELRYLLRSSDDANTAFAFNLFALETAINTYVNPDGSHQLFESETDLIYPLNRPWFPKPLNALMALAKASSFDSFCEPSRLVRHKRILSWFTASRT